MLKNSTTFFLITLIVGFVYGCGGSSNPFLEDAEDNLKTNNPSALLSAANQSIEKIPGDPLGYYYKGVALGDLASDESAANRGTQYEEMNQSFESAETVADTSSFSEKPSELSRISDIRINLWASEFNKAIQYASDDSVMNSVSNPQQYAVDHMKNATIILPDSARSWNILAQLAYGNEDMDLAIEAKEAAMERMSKPEATDYETLAAFYANTENAEKAVEALEEGVEMYPSSESLTTRLADAYQRIGESEKSIALVEELVEKNPDNIRFRISLASQIYQSALNIDEQISANFEEIEELMAQQEDATGSEEEELQSSIDNLSQENDELLAEFNAMSDRAINQLETVLEYEPMNANANNILGIVYQNKASNKFDERNRTDDIDKSAEIDEQGKEFLREAMKYYETAVEADPENKEYWRSLFRVYVTLGMDEKADEAEKKAGLDQ